MKLFLFATVIAAVPLLAQEKPAEPAKPAAPAAPAAPALPEGVYLPTELEKLKALKGQKIQVEAPIVKQGENKTATVRYLNFTENYRNSVSLVFFTSAGGGVFTKEKLAEYVGKKIRVNGELTEHQGALQIKVASLDQIKIIE